MVPRRILKPVPDFDGYFADRGGCIWSAKRMPGTEPERMSASDGDIQLSDGGRVRRRVADLVWTAFNGYPPHGFRVVQRNYNHTDNRLINLVALPPREYREWKRGRMNWLRDQKKAA